ncbi:hypothetical protein QBC47DRAFT_166603 [Echria macrotheca]|uniref:Uncharacterized protein n=1 Tax=Echria macrotheca TaxID=438768 RepID=A0AAJ0BH59_9PEZI|nr:hypothetical protein QBC47DRAFT_166603 [Echria macrotheca]
MAPQFWIRFKEDGRGELGIVFKTSQVVCRIIAVLFEIGAITFLAWAYDRWKSEPSVRVDIIFPCFFPVATAILSDSYEVVSLLFLKRKRPLNPAIVICDVAVAAVGVFCFVMISGSGYDVYKGTTPRLGTLRPLWADDINNAMIFMMVFSLLHAMFILVAALAGVYIVIVRKRAEKEERIARNQAEMIHFNERQRRRWQTRGSAQV